jgi:branched-chain amino acid transport system permease protein
VTALAKSAGDDLRPRQAPVEGRVDPVAALRDAGITAAIAFGLFLPLIGFETQVNGDNALILTTRWPLLFAVAAAVGVGRLGYSLALEP